MSSKIMLLISVLFASCGQVLFKKGMMNLGIQGISHDLAGIIRIIANILSSPLILTGLVFYGLSTLLWLFALSKTPLNYAYPFTLLTFILVMAASYFVFSEPLPVNRIIGGLLICIGIIVVSIK